MNDTIKYKVESMLQRIDVLNKRLDDRIVQRKDVQEDARAVIKETRSLVNKITDLVKIS